MPTIERKIASLARGKSAEYCYRVAAFGLMGPLPPRDRRVAKAWQAEARRKQEQPQAVPNAEKE